MSCRGGKVAWTVAHMHQTMIEHLVIISAPHPTSWTENFSFFQSIKCVAPILASAFHLPLADWQTAECRL